MNPALIRMDMSKLKVVFLPDYRGLKLRRIFSDIPLHHLAGHYDYLHAHFEDPRVPDIKHCYHHQSTPTNSHGYKDGKDIPDHPHL